MKIDPFTKFVLTVIAVNLTLLTVKNLNIIPNLYANELTNKVETPYTKYGFVPLNEDGSINVKFSNDSEIDVNLVGIDTSDNLDVNLDEIGGGHVSYRGPIKVKIK